MSGRCWPGSMRPTCRSSWRPYKSGARINPLMQAAIAHLGDTEFAALAAYYSQLAP